MPRGPPWSDRVYPVRFSAWPDVLHDGPTPLATGEEWIRARCGYLDSLVPRERAERDGAAVSRERRGPRVVARARRSGVLVRARPVRSAAADPASLVADHERRDRAKSTTRFSLVCGDEYIGLLKPEQFGPLFEARRPITAEQIAIGVGERGRRSAARTRRGFCDSQPMRHAEAISDSLPYLAPRCAGCSRSFPRR